MIRIKIKPASVNDIFKGRRFRNNYYDQYEKTLLFLLPKITLPPAPYKVSLVWGFSSKASDLDNPCKPFLDVISKKYGFNDKLITELHIKKELVSKGQEFIQFEILTAA